jgi:uncharacterized membrane protein
VNVTAQRMRKWAAATFIAALLILGLVLTRAGAGMFAVFGQLLTIFLGIVAVALMVASLFFPHEIE